MVWKILPDCVAKPFEYLTSLSLRKVREKHENEILGISSEFLLTPPVRWSALSGADGWQKFSWGTLPGSP